MADPPAGRQRLRPFAENVATGIHLAILTDAIEALDAAEKAGTPFEEAQAAIVARLQGGWTVPKAPRLTLTTTNAAAQAVSLGRVTALSSPDAVKRRPYWYFSAVLDDRVSETCFECDGTLLPAAHAWWRTHTPSLHILCRSAVVAVTASQAAKMGITAHPPKVEVEDGFCTMADLCSWEPRPGDYPVELHEPFFPMSDHTPHVHRLDLGASNVHVPTTVRPRRLGDSYEGIDFTPPKGAREEADRGLAWRREFKRGGTAIGIARARDLARGATLSPSTVQRMASYFARHEVDKQGKGWSPGEDGFPSNGRIAWALWGGDAGRAWASKVVKQMNARTASEGTARTMAATKYDPFPRYSRLCRTECLVPTRVPSGQQWPSQERPRVP